MIYTILASISDLNRFSKYVCVTNHSNDLYRFSDTKLYFNHLI